MQSDFSVELGKDDPVLELPWSSEDGSLYYVDLRSAPERINELAEISRFPELKPFLLRLNRRDTPLETAKCDAWFSRELLPEEDIFAAECKFVSYVDLFFASLERRSSFHQHEQFANDLCAVLRKHSGPCAAAELVIRRCYYMNRDCAALESMQPASAKASCEDFSDSQAEQGFCFTLYISGYGDDETEARQRWAAALQSLPDVIMEAAKRDA